MSDCSTGYNKAAKVHCSCPRSNSLPVVLVLDQKVHCVTPFCPVDSRRGKSSEASRGARQPSVTKARDVNVFSDMCFSVANFSFFHSQFFNDGLISW